MPRRNDTRSNDSKTSIAQMKELIADGGNRANAIRGEALDRLATIKGAKLTTARRERARLETKHGAADARVKALGDQIVLEHGQLVAARAESARASAPTESPGERDWILHGYVRDQNGNGLTGYRVRLFPDESGQETALLTLKSGKEGYFRYELAGRQKRAAINRIAQAPTDDKVTPGGRGTGKSFYLGVSEPRGKLLYIDTRPTPIRLGTAVYRDFTVEARRSDRTRRGRNT